MKGDKDSLGVILNKTDYIEKFKKMVKEAIDNGTYTLTEDNNIKDLHNFKTILKWNFKVSRNLIILVICYQEYMPPLKHINFYLSIA